MLGSPINLFLLVAGGLTVAINWRRSRLVRVWNPSREARPRREETAARESIWGAEYDLARPAGQPALRQPSACMPHPAACASLGQPGAVAQDPHLGLRPQGADRSPGLSGPGGRGCGRAGRPTQAPGGITRLSAALVLIPLFILSLLLVNSQAVTSVTNERDCGALDLLLVTDLSAREFVFGKLGGVFYNAKEMVLLPMLLCVFLWTTRALTGENLVYLLLRAGGAEPVRGDARPACRHELRQ